MKIQPIRHGNVYQRAANQPQKGNPQFGKLRMTEWALFSLAEELVQHPELEQHFFERVLAPLKKCLTDVVYNGRTVYIRRPEDKLYSLLAFVFKGDYTILTDSRIRFLSRYNPGMEETLIGIGCQEMGQLQAAKNIAYAWDKKGKNPYPLMKISRPVKCNPPKPTTTYPSEQDIRAMELAKAAKRIEQFMKK